MALIIAHGLKAKEHRLSILTFLILSGTFLFPGFSHAQKNIRDSSISFVTLNPTYSFNLPGGDLVHRFGITHTAGGEIGYKFVNNFYVYGGINFLFGQKVKEYTAANVTEVIGDSASGYQIMAIGSDGRYYGVKYYERGFTMPFMVGKIFNVIKSHNDNSGLYLETGFQFIQHKIRLQVSGNNIPSLDPPYRKGYDRLSGGVGIVEGIGYRYFSDNRLLNFYFGFQFSQNFTRSLRDVQYDLPSVDMSTRKDLLWGFKVGWTFPIYTEAADRYASR